MTPEREAEIRAAIAERPIGELEHLLPELLAALDAARAERDELRKRVRQFSGDIGSRVRVGRSLPSVMSGGDGNLIRYLDGLAEAMRVGRELGLWEE